MNIDIKTTHIDLTPSIRAYVEEKLNVLAGKLVDSDDTSAYAQVEVGTGGKHHKSGDVFRAEINVHTRYGDFRVVEKKGDLYAAIDMAKDTMFREMRRAKTKKVDQSRRGGLSFKRMLRRLGRRE